MIGSLHDVSYGKQVSYYSCKQDFCTEEQQYTEAVQRQERMGLLSHSVCDHESLRIQTLCNELQTSFKECRAFALG